jgi:transposase
MRQEHRAGEKAFVDYAGQEPHLVDPTTGEVRAVELFVGVLGASNHTVAEATRTQQLPDWLGSHARMFAFFGGVSVAVVCDQLKSGITGPCRYEPGLQRTYEEFAQYMGTTIRPARPALLRDKWTGRLRQADRAAGWGLVQRAVTGRSNEGSPFRCFLEVAFSGGHS